MIGRTASIVMACVVCAGCAQDRGPSMLGFQTRPAEAAEIEPGQDASQVARKSFAAKVLAAIALERVTGRKPDPDRLTELH